MARPPIEYYPQLSDILQLQEGKMRVDYVHVPDPALIDPCLAHQVVFLSGEGKVLSLLLSDIQNRIENLTITLPKHV